MKGISVVTFILGIVTVVAGVGTIIMGAISMGKMRRFY